MKKTSNINCIFLDIGGVLLSNGWDHQARARAARRFQLKATEFEQRHSEAFDTFELGKLSLEDYLNWVVFHQKRTFSRPAFRKFMCAQSTPYPKMIEWVRKLKAHCELKIVVVSNEARELNAHRIRKFKLDELVDTFVSSCFVHVRKPDPDIFRLGLDIAQVKPQQVIYIDNTPMFVRVAEGMGIRSVCHTDVESTCKALASLGVPSDY